MAICTCRWPWPLIIQLDNDRSVKKQGRSEMTKEIRTMPKVVLYTKDYCGFCAQAKALLN